MINPNQVQVSQKNISSANPGIYRITYKYKKLTAQANINVRSNVNEGITVANQIPTPGPTEVKTFSGSSKSSSPNWNVENNYQPETKIDNYNGSNGATMRTVFY